MDANTVGSQELRSVLDSFKSDISAMIIKFSNMLNKEKILKSYCEIFQNQNRIIFKKDL